MAKGRWRPFLKARAWARAQGIVSETDWRQRCTRKVLPTDLPTSPASAYKNEWISWGDFLGTGRIASQKKQYRAFADVLDWARAQGLKSLPDWKRLADQAGFPADIPKNVWQVFPSEWQGVADFLGTEPKPTCRTFSEAREWARSKGLTSEKEWRQHTKLKGWLPKDIPVTPATVYKSDWEGWGDFLGTGYVATRDRPFRPFGEAREWARRQNLTSYTDWNKHNKVAGWRPKDIPADPQATYRGEFISVADFLGTTNLASTQYREQWLTFAEAREWARRQRLDGLAAWRKFVNSRKAAKTWPTEVPTNPNNAYPSEWAGYEDWLGLPVMARRSKVEVKLKHHVASVLTAIDLKRRSVRLPNGSSQEIDICAPELLLVIEFDGYYWHGTNASIARDRKKTQALERAGWTVVRVRERPLGIIGSRDLQVSADLPPFDLAIAVLSHLADLGFVTMAAVKQYEQTGGVQARQSATEVIRQPWKTFADAQAWVQAQGIKTQKEWKAKISIDGWLPPDMPKHPLEVYHDECTSWGEFLGTGPKPTYRTFAEAREWAQAQKLKSRTEWNALMKQDGWRPADIPANVYLVYKRKAEWTDWGDFLGTGAVAPGAHHWRSFQSARTWVRDQKLSTRQQWEAFKRSKALPKDIPASPSTVYRSDWAGWPNFLGTNSQ